MTSVVYAESSSSDLEYYISFVCKQCPHISTINEISTAQQSLSWTFLVTSRKSSSCYYSWYMELVENRIPYDLMCGRAQIANAYISESKTSI